MIRVFSLSRYKLSATVWMFAKHSLKEAVVVQPMTRTVLSGVALLAFSASTLVAQASGAIVLLGRVVDDQGTPVSFASVAVLPNGPRAIADRDGAFRLPLARPGDYQLVVRQIGFHPDSSIIHAAEDAASARETATVVLKRNPIRLPTVGISGSTPCAVGGTDSVDRANRLALVPVFAALGESIARYQNILRNYPVRDTSDVVIFDSTAGHSADRPAPRRMIGSMNGDDWFPYEPGRVLQRRLFRSPRVVPISSFFFNDSAFRARHCFQYGGAGNDRGHRTYRIDFEPTASVAEPDWGGSVQIDAESYVLRRIDAVLVTPGSTSKGAHRCEWSVEYDEVFPGLTLLGYTHRIDWETAGGDTARPAVFHIIEITPRGRDFIRGAPDHSEPSTPSG